MKKNNEYLLQKAVCNYLNLQYPDVLYYSTGIGLQLTMLQGVRNKAIQKDGLKIPDLLILKPMRSWNGLFLELKISSITNKNGNFKSEHIKEQHKSIVKLNFLGYNSFFAVGFDEAKEIIDFYLK